MRYYLAGLRIMNRLCVVIGGGRVAMRKVKKLYDAGAQVRVISPDVVPELAEAAAAGRLEYEARPYQRGDLQGAWLAVAATNDPTVNRQVAVEADQSNCWVNVASEGAAGSLIVPAVAAWGDVKVAVTTSGTDPALAKALKEALVRDVAAGRGEFAKLVRDRTRWDVRGE